MRIEAKGVTVDLGGKPVLQGIDLSLGSGEMVGLIGPNGAGKTTLLRALAGLIDLRAGEIRYDGAPAKGHERQVLARRIAFLAQGGAVHWQMRAEAVVALGRLPHRRPMSDLTAADRQAVERAMTLTDALAFRDRSIDSLSGGERMRVLLARALAVAAEFLLADEPLAALDPRHQLEVMHLLRRTAHGGTGVVVILHDLALAGRFCDRLVLLDRGKLIADGHAHDVLSDAHLDHTFGISAVRGDSGGESFILPWAPLNGKG